MEKSLIAILRAVITAAPELIFVFWRMQRDVNKDKTSQTLEELIDNVDWDKEYEELLKEREKANNSWPWERIR